MLGLTEDMREALAHLNPDALMADGFDKAYVGHASQGMNAPLAVYDYSKCIDILVERDKMTHEEAMEFFEFNVAGSWVGENTPLFLVVTGGKSE